MAAITPLKKSPDIIEWIKLILQEKPVKFKKWMTGRYSSLIKLHTNLKNRQLPSGILKKNQLSLQKFDASNRSP